MAKSRRWPTWRCTWTSRTRAGWAGTTTARPAVAAYKDLAWPARPRAADLTTHPRFATNTANYYTPLDEPYFDGTDNNVRAGGTTEFYEWNRAVDELATARQAAHRTARRRLRAGPRLHRRHRAQRLGRPEPAAAAAADVDDMRIDRRRPPRQLVQRAHTASASAARQPDATRPWVDAYVFIKPPGASDGTSDSTATTPQRRGQALRPEVRQRQRRRAAGRAARRQAGSTTSS